MEICVLCCGNLSRLTQFLVTVPRNAIRFADAAVQQGRNKETANQISAAPANWESYTCQIGVDPYSQQGKARRKSVCLRSERPAVRIGPGAPFRLLVV
jgi:hypothetical protein